MFGKTLEWWLTSSNSALQVSTSPAGCKKRCPGIEEILQRVRIWIYIYIVTYQESDQILSTNRFRHHDYDHDTEIANGWRINLYSYQQHITLQKQKSIWGSSKTLSVFENQTFCSSLSHTPAFTFTFGGSFWWSPGAKCQVVQMANLPPK